MFPKDTKDYGNIRLSKIIKVFKYAYELISILLLKKIDLVYFTLTPKRFPFFRDAFYIAIMKLFKKRILVHLHGYGIKEYSKKSVLYRLVYKYTFKNIHFICLSHLVSSDISSVYDKTPHIVNYGIDDYNPKGIIKHKRNFREGITLLFLSNYMKSKGIITFIDIIGSLKEKKYNIQGQIVGNPFDYSREEIQARIAKKDLNDCLVELGPKYGQDKYDLFSKADIFIFPTLWESFGVVALEAMQFGLPIIANRVGSLPYILDFGNAGFLVNNNSQSEYLYHIENIINGKSELKKIANNSRKRFNDLFKKDKYESNISNLFADVLQL